MNTIRGSPHYAGLLPVELSGDRPQVRPKTFENDPLQQSPSRKRASRAFARFAMTFCVGVAATLAWQSYGDAARRMIVNSYPQFDWFAPRRALTVQKAPDTIALAASPAVYPDQQQFDAMLRDLHAMSQSVQRIAARQEQITRTIEQIATRIAADQQQTTHTIDQIATSIAAGQPQTMRTTDQIAAGVAAGQPQMTRTTDQTSTSVAQTSSVDPSNITVEGRADRTASQPIVRLDAKPTEAKPPPTLPERKLVSVAGAHDTSCFPSASAVLQTHRGGWPTWTMRAPGHEGTICWYASTRPRAKDHRREMMPGEKEMAGTAENRLSAPTYTRAPE